MKNKSFNLLISGQSLANFGDVFYIVALIITVYSATNSLFYVSMVPVINMLGGFLGGFLSPLLIDRYSLKVILFNSQLFKTIILLLLTLYISTGLSTNTIMIVFLLVFFISFLDGFANPVGTALVPRLVSDEYLLKANSLMSSVYQIIQMGGWAVGGLLSAILHSTGLLILTSILYILSTCLLAFIAVPVKEMKQNESISTKKNIFTSIFEGWKLIIKDRRLRIIHLVLFLGTIAGPVWISSILYPFIDTRLHKGAEWWGYINTSLLLGLFLAGLYAYIKSDLISKCLSPILSLGGFIVFLMTILFGVNVNPILSLLLIGVYGFFQELRMISINTFLQSIFKDKILAKVYAAQGSLIMATFGISTLMIGLLGERFNIVIVFLVASIFLFLSFIIFFVNRNQFSLTTEIYMRDPES